MTWNAPIPKVICSMSDNFSERSAPDVNGLFKLIAFGMKSRYHSLGVEARFLLSNRHKYGAYRSGTV